MEWQPIKTAPKDGTGMLVFCPNSLRVPVTGDIGTIIRGAAAG